MQMPRCGVNSKYYGGGKCHLNASSLRLTVICFYVKMCLYVFCHVSTVGNYNTYYIVVFSFKSYPTTIICNNNYVFFLVRYSVQVLC